MALDNHIINRWHNAEILLLGGSAGSFKLMFGIVKSLAVNFDKAVVIIIHRKRNFVSEIERMFAESSALPIKEISDKEKICKNNIYLAPPNYHTLLEKDGFFSLDVSDAVLYSKPSIDVTFESAADAFGRHCAAILFSGANNDGAEGMLKLREAGALTIVQHPEDAEMREMPNAAINISAADYVLRTIEIFELLKK